MKNVIVVVLLSLVGIAILAMVLGAPAQRQREALIGTSNGTVALQKRVQGCMFAMSNDFRTGCWDLNKKRTMVVVRWKNGRVTTHAVSEFE